MEIPYGSFFSKLYKKSFDDHIFDSAAQVGFYFSFALFPLLLFLVSLVGYFLGSSSEYQRELYFYLQQIMPQTAFELVRDTINEVTQNTSGSKLTVGLAVALWSASAGIDSLRIALNRVYDIEEQRPWILTKIMSIVLTLLLTLLISVALTGVFQGWQLISLALKTAGIAAPAPFMLVGIQWLGTLAILLVIFEVLYNILPDRRPFQWIWISPGASVAIALWLALSFGWKTYLVYFNNYDKIYGSIGAGIVLMLWLYLTALAILVGGMINSILRELNEAKTATSINVTREDTDVDNAP
ncbi:MAG: YihY/virulence factor BrkB family protein [Acidobacteriota bacterium]|nr:YihY/virulence factor BrkB family protein [Acidobacteriota bacterium]MDH3529696.1 YihY/virulence factor BrkB family protein [Acidobacteriota bacterium]